MTKWQNKWLNKKCLLFKVSCFSQVQTLPGELTASPAIRSAPWPAPCAHLIKCPSLIGTNIVSPDSTERWSRGGHVARLRSVGCRAGAAPELRRGRFNRKGEAPMRFDRFDGRGKTGLLPGFVLSDAAQARHRNYAEADLTEKAKRRCVSTDSTGEEKRGYCPASFCRMPRRRGTGTTPRQI